MTIYPNEVVVALTWAPIVLMLLTNTIGHRIGDVASLVGFVLVAASAMVSCTFAALFGFWITAGVAGATLVLAVFLAFCIANTLDTKIAAAAAAPSAAEQPEQETVR